MVKEKKVIILLSTYNGEKYIEQQINSLLKQTYKNINIYVRDDGSKDGTLEILKKYEEKGEIFLIQGKNIGFINSFMELLKKVEKADYYSFCDQDDVWNEDKIERAVRALEKEDNDKILLYASNYEFYDSNMEFLGKSPYKNKRPSFQKAIVECISPGMTMMINEKARKEVANNTPNYCAYHDWWMYLVASAFGKVVYDNTPTVKYRRHKENVSEEEAGVLKLIVRTIKRRKFSNIWNKLKKQLINFNEIYGENLKEEDKKILKLFINEKFSFRNYFRKIFYNGRYKDKIKDEIVIRIMFALGKI